MQTIACEGRAFVLSANQCVRRKNLPAWIKEENRSSEQRADKKQSMELPDTRLRRLSTVTKTEDNHEITWPSAEPGTIQQTENNGSEISSYADQDDDSTSDTPTPRKIPRRASIITKTEDNHEITWPSSEITSQHSPPSMQDSNDTASASPLRLTTIPIDDKDDDDLKSPSSFHRLAKTPSNHLIALPSSLPHSQSALKMSSIPSAPNPGSSSGEEFVCRGGSCIISPTGDVLAGPLWEVETGGLLIATIDFEDCERGRLDLDVAGSYGRGDAFELRVRGLDINPPP